MSFRLGCRQVCYARDRSVWEEEGVLRSLPLRTSGRNSLLRIAIAAFSLLLLALPVQADAVDESSPLAVMTNDDLAAGRGLFAVHCGRCHGMLGEGGEGPSLKRPRLANAPTDERLLEVIQEGIQGTGMPGTWAMNDLETLQLAAYVRSLGRLPPEPLPGDPVAGREVFAAKGACASCHITAGVGRAVGPELTDVGLRRNAAYLRRALTHPDADSPMLNDRLMGRIDAFLTVRVLSEEGEFEGLRVSEDEFSVQLRDLSGTIRSFDKPALLGFERAFGHSLMPGYEAELTATELEDLVSYLMSLKGEE